MRARAPKAVLAKLIEGAISRANLRRARLSATGARAARQTPAAHLVRNLRLRAGRTLCGEESLRPSGAMRNGPALGHRHRRVAVQDGHPGGRHRSRHVCAVLDPCRAPAAGPRRRRRHARHHDVRVARGVDGVPGVLHRLRRIASAARRRVSRHHRPLWSVPRGRRAQRVPRSAERPRVRASRDRAGKHGARRGYLCYATGPARDANRTALQGRSSGCSPD